jgi:hypothetical protein
MYTSWHFEGLKVTKQLDYFFVSNQKMDRKSTHDAKRTGIGIESDHAAIGLSLKFKLNQTTERQKPKVNNNPINWRQLFRDNRIKELFMKTVDKQEIKERKQSENENDDENILQISELNEIIMETAKTVLTKPKVRQQPDWYVMNEREMAKISRERNMAYDNLALNPDSCNAR